VREQVHLLYPSGPRLYQPISHQQLDVFQNIYLVHSQTSGDVLDGAGTACKESKDVFTADDGLVGQTVEESLRNLGRITLEAMFRVDPTMLTILQDKTAASGKA
jgi:hypothetical protein